MTAALKTASAAGLLALVTGAGAALAAIEHDEPFDGGGFATATMAFLATIAPGADRYVLMGTTAQGTTAIVKSAVMDGVPLSFIGAVNSAGGACRMEWWGLVAPVEGVHQVNVVMDTTTVHSGATLISYRGVDPNLPVQSFASAAGLRGPTAVTIPSVPGGVVLDATCGRGPNARLDIAGSGQRANWHWLTEDLSSAGSEKAGAAAVTMTWTANGDNMLDWASAGIALNPAGGPSGDIKLKVTNASCALSGAPHRSPATGWVMLAGLLVLGALRRRR